MVQKAKNKESKEAKQKRREARRQLRQEEQISAAVREWTNILPHWNELKSTKKVRELWGNGLPPCVRGKVWMLAIGNELNITKELFQICVSRAQERLKKAEKESADKAMTNKPVSADCENDAVNRENSVEVIHLDLSRTFPSLGIFQQGGPYYDALLTLLGAYVCYRPDVGYVQGMSFVAAVLLLNLDLFDAFTAFGNLMNHPCLIAFFQVKQEDMNIYFSAFERCLQSLSPDLYQHFLSLDIRPNLYLIDWLYTIYAKSLPLEITCRIWDVFLRILTLYKDSLLTLDFDRIVHFLTHLPDKVPTDDLFKCIDSLRSTLQKERKSFCTFLQSCRDEDASKS
ncbi:unnamed protein product [Soboliphyme baturini]|uniref:Rab-GAP TBC domain-containing protein n=1 Tax=Soboliphyme baturini TaxID=241478 RepID=A0A183ISQ4_9BILA|nr:unnamed protein product [Soboliphyme baturini]